MNGKPKGLFVCAQEDCCSILFSFFLLSVPLGDLDHLKSLSKDLPYPCVVIILVFFFVKGSMFLLFSVSLILHEISNLALPEIFKFHHSMNNAHNLELKSVESSSSVSLCCLKISEKSD